MILAGSVSARETKKETLKIESDKPISVVLKMTQTGGKVVLRGSNKKDELQVSFSSESGASVSQSGNTITIEGQQKPSTYTVMLPRGGDSVEVEINGTKHTIRKGYNSDDRIEFEIQ
jgi:hypothetical protein